MIVQPVTLQEARAYIALYHRHHKPPVGHLFSIGANDDERLIGVACVGRPVARRLDDGLTCEVTRLCTDGTRNASSFLLGAARRIAFAMGYARIITYTLPEEGGASLRASGWICEGAAGGGSWQRTARIRSDAHPLSAKVRWSSLNDKPTARVRFAPKTEGQLTLI